MGRLVAYFIKTEHNPDVILKTLTYTSQALTATKDIPVAFFVLYSDLYASWVQYSSEELDVYHFPVALQQMPSQIKMELVFPIST